MKIKQYVKRYSNLVTFDPNKETLIHRWYPFVEGFSYKLVESLINEQTDPPRLCFDPFGGVGTTALTCQSMDINCISVESNPFFYDITKAKLRAGTYRAEVLGDLLNRIEVCLAKKKGNSKHPKLESKTFFQSSKKSKWIFHQAVSNAVFDIQEEIKTHCVKKYSRYRSLLTLCLAATLLEVSNVFRNGKCLSYKKNWEKQKYSRKQVHKLFLGYVREIILPDLRNLARNKTIDNSNGNLILGDARTQINSNGNKIDLVITSPPYLNSRDYADVYRLELWMLGYVEKFRHERKLRKRALTSHVQIPLSKVEYPDIPKLKKAVEYLEKKETKLWNRNIPNMVRGYFNDIQKVLVSLKVHLNDNAKIFINVSNSTYANRIIEVDKIIAEIAEKVGYHCEEIRVARYIKTSSQQYNSVNRKKMRESVIVLQSK